MTNTRDDALLLANRWAMEQPDVRAYEVTLAVADDAHGSWYVNVIRIDGGVRTCAFTIFTRDPQSR